MSINEPVSMTTARFFTRLFKSVLVSAFFLLLPVKRVHMAGGRGGAIATKGGTRSGISSRNNMNEANDDSGSISVILVVILPVLQMFLFLGIIILIRLCWKRFCNKSNSPNSLNKQLYSENIAPKCVGSRNNSVSSTVLQLPLQQVATEGDVALQVLSPVASPKQYLNMNNVVINTNQPKKMLNSLDVRSTRSQSLTVQYDKVHSSLSRYSDNLNERTVAATVHHHHQQQQPQPNGCIGGHRMMSNTSRMLTTTPTSNGNNNSVTGPVCNPHSFNPLRGSNKVTCSAQNAVLHNSMLQHSQKEPNNRMNENFPYATNYYSCRHSITSFRDNHINNSFENGAAGGSGGCGGGATDIDEDEYSLRSLHSEMDIAACSASSELEPELDFIGRLELIPHHTSSEPTLSLPPLPPLPLPPQVKNETFQCLQPHHLRPHSVGGFSSISSSNGGCCMHTY